MGEMNVGVECGPCGSGPVYFETCGVGGCEYATASECQNCGARWPIACPDHPSSDARSEADDA
jgi:hypothetical protein